MSAPSRGDSTPCGPGFAMRSFPAMPSLAIQPRRIWSGRFSRSSSSWLRCALPSRLALRGRPAFSLPTFGARRHFRTEHFSARGHSKTPGNQPGVMLSAPLALVANPLPLGPQVPYFAVRIGDVRAVRAGFAFERVLHAGLVVVDVICAVPLDDVRVPLGLVVPDEVAFRVEVLDQHRTGLD